VIDSEILEIHIKDVELSFRDAYKILDRLQERDPDYLVAEALNVLYDICSEQQKIIMQLTIVDQPKRRRFLWRRLGRMTQ
jgi:hypothetical protein